MSFNSNNFRWYHVDDDLDDLEIYNLLISEVEPRVKLQTFTSSIEMIRKINSAEDNPRLILIDLNMPVMDGLTCLKHVKILPHIKDFTRLIILSTSSDKETIDNCYRAGAHFYAVKPSDPEKVKSLINNLVDIAQGQFTWPISKKQFLLTGL